MLLANELQQKIKSDIAFWEEKIGETNSSFKDFLEMFERTRATARIEVLREIEDLFFE